MPLPRSVPLRDGRNATLRRARPDDAEAWRENVGTVAAERIFLMTETFSRTLEELRRQFDAAGPRLELWLVAELDGKVVGGANVARGKNSKNAHVADLGMALLPSVRGLGLGSGLLAEIVAWAGDVGIARLKLGVFATNERAIALYRKFGFVTEGRLVGEVILDGVPVDEILMALKLRPPT